MGKINKLITISTELDEKLKEEQNASLLIRELLEQYYNKEDSNDLDYLQEKRDEAKDIIDTQSKIIDRINSKIQMLVEQSGKAKEFMSDKKIKLKEYWLKRKEINNLFEAGKLGREGAESQMDKLKYEYSKYI